MNNHKVLLVDDETFVRVRVSQLIGSSGLPFEVVGEAADGADALSLVESVRPQVIFTDIRMPRMDGLSFIKELRERFPDIYILILTGYDKFEYAQQALRYKVDEFLLKPVSRETLYSVLNKVHLELYNNQNRDNRYKQLVQTTIDRLLNDFLAKRIDAPLLKLHLEEAEFHFSFESYCLAVTDEPALAKNMGQEMIQLEGPHGLPVWLIPIRKGKSIVYPKVACKIGVSRPFGLREDSLELLQTAYQQAVKALNRKWFFHFDVLEADLLEVNKTADSVMPHYILMKKVIRDSEEGQLGNSNQLISGIFRQFGREKHVELNFLQQLIHEMNERLSFISGIPLLRDKETALSAILKCGTLAELEAAVLEFVHRFGSMLGVQRDKTNPFVEKALSYIHSHFNEEITLTKMSEYVSLNPNYFCGLFKSVTGMNFKYYLAYYRMEMAKELLLEGCWKPTEVSFMVGYTDEKYFSRVFKKMTGFQPHQFGKAKKAAT